jgi:hypothetical protein
MTGALFFLTLSDSTDTRVVDVKGPETQVPAVKTPAATVESTTAPVVAATVPKATPKAATQETTPAKAPVLAAANTARTTVNTATPAANTATNTTANQTIDLANVPTEQHDNNNAVIAADISKQLKQIPGNEVAVNRPSIEVGTSAPLATPAPAAKAAEPGELIMSVTGNGLESKVLDKVTNVARLFAKKRNK